RRPTNVARGHRQRGRREQARNERRAVHDVLAFPAAGLAGTVLAAVVDMSVRIAGPGPAETAAGGYAPMPQDGVSAIAQDQTPEGWRSIVSDWSADKQTFHVPWGKAMMWIFLVSDTFIFSCFLVSYMNVRISTTVPWPNASEVFALQAFGGDVPLLLIAIMTFVLITSSGTMAMAVNFGYRRDRARTTALMLFTAGFGAVFVGMQAFEWTKLILEGVRPWENPFGA